MARNGTAGALLVATVLAASLLMPTQAGATGFTVTATVHSWVFDPSVVYVGTGDTVVWTNVDGPSQASHVVAADDGSFASSPIPPGGTFSHTFTTAGTVTVRDPLIPYPNAAAYQTIQVQSSTELPKLFFPNGGIAESVCSLPVQLTRPTPNIASVTYTTRNGTAREKTDYAATTGTLTFAAGESKRTITIKTYLPRLGDEAAEFFYVDLSNPSNLQLAEVTGRCTFKFMSSG